MAKLTKTDSDREAIMDQIGSLRIQQLQELVLLLNFRSMGSIANHLGISQATLSKHLSTVEKAVGVPLFERDYRLSLTPAGVILAEGLVRALNDIQNQVRYCRTVAQEGIVEIRVESDGLNFYAQNACKFLFQAFREQHENVMFRTVPFTTKSLKRSFRKGVSDVGFWYDFGDIDEIVERRRKDDLSLVYLYSEKMIVWASVDHPILALDTITPADIAQYSIMSPEPVGHVRSYKVHEALFQTPEYQRYTLNEDVRFASQLTDFLSLDTDGSIYILPGTNIKEPAITCRRDMKWRYISDEPISHMFLACNAKTNHQEIIELADFVDANISKVKLDDTLIRLR